MTTPVPISALDPADPLDGSELLEVTQDDSGLKSRQATAGQVVRGPVAALTPTSGAVTIDVDTHPGGAILTHATAGDTTFSTDNLVTGVTFMLVLTETGSVERTLTFPAGWTWYGAPVPATLAADGSILVTFTSLGTTDADVIAAWSEEQ